MTEQAEKIKMYQVKIRENLDLKGKKEIQKGNLQSLTEVKKKEKQDILEQIDAIKDEVTKKKEEFS